MLATITTISTYFELALLSPNMFPQTVQPGSTCYWLNPDGNLTNGGRPQDMEYDLTRLEIEARSRLEKMWQGAARPYLRVGRRVKAGVRKKKKKIKSKSNDGYGEPGDKIS